MKEVDVENVYPSPSKKTGRGISKADFSNEWMTQADLCGPPSPPNTAPLVSVSTFGPGPSRNSSIDGGRGVGMEFTRSDTGYSSSGYSSMSVPLSPTMSSFQSSPDMPHATLMGNPTRHVPELAATSQAYSFAMSQTAVNLASPVRDAFPPRAMSSSELNLDSSLDVSIEDTGVTIDEIASFIQGPDPHDGKWMCVYLDCNKKFGRKENIKSHVQTHLGDRQFRCNHCRKCFVRQHDLKRHSKIHSGVKPYPCACGNSFARHDALTRHRQRGVCCGAFEGIVKKQVKRGRPKKTRPELDERLDKAERSRQKAKEKMYASSTSPWSESSFPASPPLDVDNLNIRGSSPFDNFQSLPGNSFSGATDVFTYTPPMSPGYSTGNCVSPEQTQYSPVRTKLSSSPSARPTLMPGIVEESESDPFKSSSPRVAADSQAGSPPELCLTSSSPPASKYFDLEASSEAEGKERKSYLDNLAVEFQRDSELPGMSEDELCMDPFGLSNHNHLSALERDPTMLLLAKLDDPFYGDDIFSDHFTHSSDDFFTSP